MMAHAEKCPVCGGSGKVKAEFNAPGGTAQEGFLDCHGCNGKGWVEVSDSATPFPCKPSWLSWPKFY